VNVILCGSELWGQWRRVILCPTEATRRRMVVRDHGWWGVTWHCCGCGDSWSDGERLPRPFMRGWRDKAITRHRAMWDQEPFDHVSEHLASLHTEVAG